MKLNLYPESLPFISDLNYVADGVGSDWIQIKNRSILITGGTGIIGKWLISTLLHADYRYDLGIKTTIISRNPVTFKNIHPYWAADTRLNWIQGDVRSVELPPGSEFSHVIHAATDVLSTRSAEDVLDTCISGTQRVLGLANLCGASRLLFLSSGAVYGKTPPELGAIPESFNGSLDSLAIDSAYAQGKRTAELFCAIENAKGKITIPIARCFAMVGPYLPLDKHFAIGNFIGAAISNKPITIEGDGTPIRSYMYLADVALRLWLILLKGQGAVAYNLGGDEPLTIEALAKLVALKLGADVEIDIKRQALHGAHANVYYPDTRKIRNDFSIGQGFSLAESIVKTAIWYRTFSTQLAK
jgi:nucleoside-diphosphate-sugar epimerase